MDKRKTSHDILNILERLRIMHDLAYEQSFEHVSKDELLHDLDDNLKLLKEKFEELVQ